jgi:hypothetical protein
MGLALDCPGFSGASYRELEQAAADQGSTIRETYRLPGYCRGAVRARLRVERPFRVRHADEGDAAALRTPPVGVAAICQASSPLGGVHKEGQKGYCKPDS